MVRIFSTKGTKLVEITEEQFPLERHIQRLTEENLQEIFELDLVKTEFDLHGFRIDTLAYDRESRAFVIIEYKKDRDFSVVEQGMAYLNLMLRYKSDFIVEYNESSSGNLKRSDIDWSQSRLIFIAPEFTKYQQNAIGFRDFAIELWEVHKYLTDLLIFNELKPPEVIKESIRTIAKNSPAAKNVSEEIKVYTEEDHLNRINDQIKELYSEIRSAILMLGNDIRIIPKKRYIAFRRKQNIITIKVSKSKLKLYLSNIKKDQIHDPLNKARDVEGVISAGLTEVTIKESKEIPYILPFIREAYRRTL